MSENPSGWAVGLTALAGILMTMLGGCRDRCLRE